VRPDGKISLPLLNEIQASGLTPEQLRGNITQAANRYVEDPAVTVVVKTINSRKVFITGEVGRPGRTRYRVRPPCCS
jgi:polysaccharide export outer membrane protein